MTLDIGIHLRYNIWMPTKVIQPKFDIDTARDIVKNNSRVIGVNVVLHTSEKWLPLILSQAGFFPSNGEVKRNRPDLWREVSHGEVVSLKWAEIRVCKHDCNRMESDQR